MRGRNWKKLQPTSLRHAMELCKDHAREKRNYSVERIAEEMGQEDHWTLYKWFQSGRIPAVLIPAFEAACGIDFVSRWLATRGGKLVIEMPTGRSVKSADVNTLQQVLHTAVGSLMAFYDDKKEAAETLADITNALESLAWHKGNVEQHSQPQLELGDTHD
jgi:hypothetical protein